MLSKSQAKIFFLGGTFLFSAVFIFLTVDTIRQTGKRTNSQNLSESVINGKLIWEKNNCMGCHTLLGEGGYYAPDLTQVVSKRGDAWIRVFLDDPEAMFPGERKMVKYKFTNEEKTNLIDFFSWVEEIDTNGWPPAPNITNVNLPQKKEISADVQKDIVQAPLKFQQLCIACHSLGGEGGVVGPKLDHIGTKFDSDYLNRWILNPQALKPGTAMPQLPMTDSERKEIVLYLSSLK